MPKYKGKPPSMVSPPPITSRPTPASGGGSGGAKPSRPGDQLTTSEPAYSPAQKGPQGNPSVTKQPYHI